MTWVVAQNEGYFGQNKVLPRRDSDFLLGSSTLIKE